MVFVTIGIAALLVGFGWFSYRGVTHRKWLLPTEPFPSEWRAILEQEVVYYTALTAAEKKRFEFKMQEFLLNCKVTGIETEVSLKDELLVAASAVIPIFGFKTWKYTNVHEVLVYPDRFGSGFELEGNDRNILGMVGNRNMEGIMILSKEALELGFKNETDKRNTAIHEFVHLVDKSDGEVDGLPVVLMQKRYALPWIERMEKEIELIRKGKSDINPYGGTNRAEFLSVVSEYFFERPELLERKHPELYRLLEKIYNQKMSRRKMVRKKFG